MILLKCTCSIRARALRKKNMKLSKSLRNNEVLPKWNETISDLKRYI